MRTLVLAAAAIAVISIWIWIATRAGQETFDSGRADTATPVATPVVADRHAAATGNATAATTDDRASILCPDGTRLPSLNGVLDAPAIQRPPEHGPLPPVIATRTDANGDAWYEHADGSMTTTRMQTVFDAMGRPALQPITIHTADLPADGSIRSLPHPAPDALSQHR